MSSDEVRRRVTNLVRTRGGKNVVSIATTNLIFDMITDEIGRLIIEERDQQRAYQASKGHGEKHLDAQDKIFNRALGVLIKV